MISCGRVKKLISSYLERDLDSSVRDDIAEHIRFCSHCFALEQSLKKLLEATREIPAKTPSTGLNQRILRSINSAPDSSSGRRRSQFAFRRWVWTVPAAAAVALLLFVVNSRLTRSPENSAPNLPVVSAQLQAEQTSSGVDQSSQESTESIEPVEFVMDNWNQSRLPVQTYFTQSESDTLPLLFPASQEQRLPDDWRIYVMPVVQNQMAGYKTKQPY